MTAVTPSADPQSTGLRGRFSHPISGTHAVGTVTHALFDPKGVTENPVALARKTMIHGTQHLSAERWR
jgi:hypothetical protein